MSERPLTVGSLFAGIGGFDLGFQRAGYEIKWQSEIDVACVPLLQEAFPGAKQLGDITKVKEFPSVDVIVGGFPCQDISVAGKRAGVSGGRSGLFREMVRAIRMVRPRFAVMENVAALLDNGMGDVLGSVAEVGYDTEWDCLPASAFSAPHTRDRVFIVAYPDGERCGTSCVLDSLNEVPNYEAWGAAKDKRDWAGWQRWIGATFQAGYWGRADAEVLGMADGLPNRVDRIRGLGNAIVPQIAQWIAERILMSITSEVLSPGGSAISEPSQQSPNPERNHLK